MGKMPFKLMVINNTKIDFENKSDRIHSCVKSCFGEEEIESLNVICDDVGYKTPNFTTSGIIRLHGSVRLKTDEVKPWKMIVKIIKSDSVEKNLVEHHNYWRREALVFESGILKELPDSIKTTKCYLVEEFKDGTIWIWMEYIEADYANTLDQFSYISRQLGLFNGAYLIGEKELPQYEWICKAWHKSWTTSSLMYAPNVDTYIERLSDNKLKKIWSWHQGVILKLNDLVDSLQQIPRVLAHQDLSQMNMLLKTGHNQSPELVLIDWQFMSISGIGEDLGKLYGVNMSLGIIKPDQYEVFQTVLYNSYLDGLRSAGWQGDEKLARYGFYLSTALRSVWEVPQYFSILAKLEIELGNALLEERLSRLEKILSIQMKMEKEARSLMIKTFKSHLPDV